jgi:hypothetical protein
MAEVRLRPRRVRVVCAVTAVAVVVLFTAIAQGLTGRTGDGFGQFQRGDRFAMIGLGVLIAAGVLAFARPRVQAGAERIRVRNVVGGYDLPWTVVRRVRFDRHSAWAVLELHDDETVPLHAVQATDRQYAVDGVRALRALHAAAIGAPTEG